MDIVDKINQDGVSIVIGARNEAKTLPMTVNNLMEDMHASGITKWEFVIQDNGSDDETSLFYCWKPTDKSGRWQYTFSPRGMVAENRLRVFFDPVYSNVGTRNHGVNHSRYENIIFADAHISVRPGTIMSTLKALYEFGGIIHSPVAWMGSCSTNPQQSYQYSYKVGEKIWGTWNRLKIADTPFYIPICGHCWLAVKKKEFVEKRGYPYAQRVYGGGEPYLDTKWWMTGSTSMCDPGSLVYHLSAGRGYNWDNADLIHNMFLVSYILGGEKWSDRLLITYLNKSGTDHDYVRKLHGEALKEGQEDKDWLDANKIMEFDELLALDKPQDRTDGLTRRPHAMRLWDIKNEELHGTHGSFVQEFKLERKDGRVYIGDTEITDPEALQIASKYV